MIARNLLGSSDDEAPTACMALSQRAAAVTGAAKLKVSPSSSGSFDWDLVQDPNYHLGVNNRFTGVMEDKSFQYVIQKFPSYHLEKQVRKGKQISGKDKRFKDWADQEMAVDKELAGTACRHTSVSKSGSSARYIRYTCKDCGIVWQEERHTPFLDPSECPHLNTEHRGSTHFEYKTFCKDCDTQISSVPQELRRALEQEEEDSLKPTVEEALILECGTKHDQVSKVGILEGSQANA